MEFRPLTSAGRRPGSGARPFTTTRSLGLPLQSATPSAGNRMISTPINHPGTRSGLAQGLSVMSHINIADRPMSQQGLVTPRTGLRAPRRLVQDKTYFIGLLRSKYSELSSEISRLTREIDLLSKEQSTYLTFEKRAEQQVSELKDLQGLLADYNLLVDKLNTDAEMSDVQEECKELKIQNDAEADVIESLFEKRKGREVEVQQLEAEIMQESYMTDNLISSLKPEQQKKFVSVRKANKDLQKTLEKLHQNSDSLNNQKIRLEEELHMSQTKQQAVMLHSKLREVEEKRNNLIEESKCKGTPEEEKESLLQQVKEDNAELASIERQCSEAKEMVERLRVEALQLDQELEDHQGERITKYKELKKREETMDAFLASFDENKGTECEKRSQMESAILASLEKISRNLSHFHHLPSPQDLSHLKDDLVFKESEMEKSRITATSLSHEQKKLSMDLSKIEQLETKIQQELEMLQQKITCMEQEMATYSDLNKLKVAAEEKKEFLTREEKLLSAKHECTKKVVGDLNATYELLKSKISSNETYIQLNNLEHRLQHLEQNNFSVSEFVANKKEEMDYSVTKQDVKALIGNLNQYVQSQLS